MGTRSYVACERQDGRIFAQYLQFDGYPTEVGQRYFEWIVDRFAGCPSYFLQDEQVGTHKDWEGTEQPIMKPVQPYAPSKQFFRMVRSYLHQAQWASHHTINNRRILTVAEYEAQDSWMEWKYLFRRNGDFEIRDDKVHYLTLPFALLVGLAEHQSALGRFQGGDSLMNPFWAAVQALEHRDDEPEEGEEPREWVTPSLELRCGELQAFPPRTGSAADEGWREWSQLFVNGQLVDENLFGKQARQALGAVRNEHTISSQLAVEVPV